MSRTNAAARTNRALPRIRSVIAITMVTLAVAIISNGCGSSTKPTSETVAAPIFSPAGGSYSDPQSVVISTTTTGATIRYSTDGSIPTSTTGTVYSAPIVVGTSETIKAIAYASGLGDSPVVTATYTIGTTTTPGTVATPTFSPDAGSYDSPQTVTLSTTTPGAEIRYTTDGSIPTSVTGTVYAGPISVDSTQTIQAIAYESGWADSAVAVATYTIGHAVGTTLGVVATPTIRPADACVSQTLVIDTTTPGAEIRYTTDGSTPTSTTGTVYSGPIRLESETSYPTTKTIQAIAYKAGWTDSSVSTEAYPLGVAMGVDPPSFSLAAGSYAGTQELTITATAGTTIHYTTDGSTPIPMSKTGAVYTGPISIPTSRTIKAVAYQCSRSDSAVVTSAYSITQYFAYVANGDSNDISAYTIDASTGILTQIEGSPFMAGTNPYGVAVDPKGRFVYVANNGTNDVSAYTINAGTGLLTEIADSPFAAGANPYGIAVDPTGQFVYVTNHGASSVSAYTIESNGALTEVAGSPFTSALHPIAIAVHPDGKFVYVANEGASSVSTFAIDATTGALAKSTADLSTAHANPNGVAVDPQGNFAYVISAADGYITHYNPIAAANGALTFYAAYAAKAKAIAIDPQGKFAYQVSSDSNNSPCLFPEPIYNDYGSLGSNYTYAVGTNPKAVAADPTGNFVYVANAGSDDISGYAVISQTTIPTHTAINDGVSFAAGSAPSAIATIAITLE